mgnify:CR=1 FL=1
MIQVRRIHCMRVIQRVRINGVRVVGDGVGVSRGGGCEIKIVSMGRHGVSVG